MVSMVGDFAPQLPPIGRLLVVVAHPDDESFGLGAIIDTLASNGVPVAVLCFTHGEASTLHARRGDLRRVRAAELSAAARILGIERTDLLDFPDGTLALSPTTELVAQVTTVIGVFAPTHLLVFDDTGVTGHVDHIAATRAALRAAALAELPVLAWTLTKPVADALNAEHGTAFAGRSADLIDFHMPVPRQQQRRAIAAHASQSGHNPVLRHRLNLLGGHEFLRWLLRPQRIDQGDIVYGYTTRLPEAFTPAVVERVKAALKEQGFGVLTEIDVKATLRDKLAVDMEDYLILGACNPPLVHRALGVDREIGLLLPCNVVVRADGEATLVQALDPQVMVSVTGRPELKPVADDAAARLRAALDSLTA